MRVPNHPPLGGNQPEPIRRYKVQTALGEMSLASDERLVSISKSSILLPRRTERPLDVLLKMAGVKVPEELGNAGPVIAALANSENAHNPDLRRYEAKFGRDALYTAEFLSDMYPNLELATVQYLAAYQATELDDRRQAAPGKVPNHIRPADDPLAIRLSRETGRAWPWYGATDTTVQFQLAACRVIRREPRLFHAAIPPPLDRAEVGQDGPWSQRTRTLGESVLAAGAWLIQELEHGPMHGLMWAGLNRKDSFTVWTDSPNAFHHADGQLTSVPVAPVQLQGQAYDALLSLADVCAALGQTDPSPAALRAWAGFVRSQVLAHFVVSDGRGTFLASGLDGGVRPALPLAVRTVNMGFLLDSGLLDGLDASELRNSLVEQLFSPEMLSPFGLVGRSRDGVRFERFDYHAQVWAFAVHKVANGLARRGLARLARDLDKRVLRQTRDGLLPENVGAGTSTELEYCEHVLTVVRPTADRSMTTTVKERPPAPYAAWTAGAVLQAQGDPRRFSRAPVERSMYLLEEQVSAELRERGEIAM